MDFSQIQIGDFFWFTIGHRRAQIYRCKKFWFEKSEDQYKGQFTQLTDTNYCCAIGINHDLNQIEMERYLTSIKKENVEHTFLEYQPHEKDKNWHALVVTQDNTKMEDIFAEQSIKISNKWFGEASSKEEILEGLKTRDELKMMFELCVEFSHQNNADMISLLQRVTDLFSPTVDSRIEQQQEDLFNEIRLKIKK